MTAAENAARPLTINAHARCNRRGVNYMPRLQRQRGKIPTTNTNKNSTAPTQVRLSASLAALLCLLRWVSHKVALKHKLGGLASVGC
jgi:hypothetical protein